MTRTYFRGAQICVLAALLAVSPFGFDLGGGSLTQAEAAAGGNGKGNGNAGGHGHGGAHSQAGSNKQGGRLRRGNKNGNSKVHIASGQLKSNGQLNAKNDLGRLNAFMHASSKALLSAAPGSAIGIIAVQYRDALSAYLGGTATIDDAAAILAKAANKTLTPDIVAAINERLAAENPNDANFAALTDQVNADLSDAANSVQQTEANQGLGPPHFGPPY